MNTVNQFFIGHSHLDTPYAQKLTEALRAKNLTVFSPSDSMLAGDPWDQETLRAIQESEVSVFLITNDTKGDYYYLENIATAIKGNGKDRRVVPIVLSDNRGDPEIPYGLRRLTPIEDNGNPSWSNIARKLARTVRSDTSNVTVLPSSRAIIAPASRLRERLSELLQEIPRPTEINSDIGWVVWSDRVIDWGDDLSELLEIGRRIAGSIGASQTHYDLRQALHSVAQQEKSYRRLAVNEKMWTALSRATLQDSEEMLRRTVLRLLEALNAIEPA